MGCPLCCQFMKLQITTSTTDTGSQMQMTCWDKKDSLLQLSWRACIYSWETGRWDKKKYTPEEAWKGMGHFSQQQELALAYADKIVRPTFGRHLSTPPWSDCPLIDFLKIKKKSDLNWEHFRIIRVVRWLGDTMYRHIWIYPNIIYMHTSIAYSNENTLVDTYACR